MRTIISWAVIIAVAVAGLGLAWLNASPVKIDFMYTSYEVPLALLVSVCVGFGVLIGALISTAIVLRLRRRVSAMERDKTHAGSAGVRVVPLKTSF